MTLNDTNEKKSEWLLPEGTKNKLSPGLYLVSTPIGNLRDVTIRALDTLAASDIILCEDTRVSGKLLAAYMIKGKKLVTYNDHASAETRDYIKEQVRQGRIVSLISDAGTPLISDPGYKLAQQCKQEGLYVTSMPGANAALTALQLSSFPSDAFSFIGFLPSKSKARQDVLLRWSHVQSTLIAFETAPRLLKSLSDIGEVLKGRKVAVVREITKLYEEARIDEGSALIDYYERKGLPKGEIVLVMSPPEKKDWSDNDVKQALRTLLVDMPTKKAAAEVAQQSNRPKKDVYDLALEVKNNDERS